MSALGKDIPPELRELINKGDIDLLLSGDSESTLNDMITKGVFRDKSDFLGFLVNQYVANNLGSKLSVDRTLPESLVMDIIRRTGLDKKYPNVDFKRTLVPLLVTSFYAIYRYVSRQRMARPA
jgi:hypothetical protein